MARLQTVENALININETIFQELCDCFLAIRNNNYRAFSRTGSQIGKQKTTKGTPDSYFLLPNGNFIYVEVTTNQSDKKKLENDIKACFDAKKSKIPNEKIEEIILCFNWNIKQNEITQLDTLAKTYNPYVNVTYFTLQNLAIELLWNHRDLAQEYLGLPFDSGQIVSVERFIGEYNRASKGIATPIDNTFLHREKELEELKEAIANNDFVILAGSPGVGKTKLAIEGIKSFLLENLDFEAYCISYKGDTLLDDLYQYFDSEKNYILFVDDANRIDAFNQIIGFYKGIRKGILKIIITVRDYAFQNINALCQEFAPKRLDLIKFSDEEIIDIIKSQPFKILNSDYHKEILRIADGNPRLAIMTALLAKAEQNIYALADVSDLFESYFSTFIKDDGEFAEDLNIKCLGIIAFFYTIPYKNREITSSILESFGIDYSSFIDSINKLNKLELVEIQFEYVKIPEQNLATYFFYKAFIKDNLLSFEILLNKYFDNNSSRFKDCVIPANNTFGFENVVNKIKPYLKNYWKLIQKEEEQSFKLLSTFWYYLPDEVLEFAYNTIEALPVPEISNYKVTYENNAFTYERNNIIELLGEFFRFHAHLKDAIELAFEYVRRKTEYLPELIHKIRERLTFDKTDKRYSFYRQITLFQILIEGVNKKDKLLASAFYELSKTFLAFNFQHTESGRNLSFHMYNYLVPNIRGILEFRRDIWDAVKDNFEDFPNKSFDLLQAYASPTPDVSKEIMEYDLPYLINIIETYLVPDSFEHCKYVQDQIRWCKRNAVFHPSFFYLTQNFSNTTYEIFLKIDWNRLRDKEMYEFDDFGKYDELKELEIRKSFVFKSEKEVKEFYNIFLYLSKFTKNHWNFNKSLEYIIDENFLKNIDLGYQLLLEILESDNEVNYIPRMVFRNHLNTEAKANHIWEILQKQEFCYKAFWELSYYDYLDDSLLRKNHVLALIDTVSNMKDSSTIHFDRLQRFLTIEPDLFQIILKVLVEINKKEEVRLQVWIDFFDTHFDQLGNDIDLIKKAYLQQDQMSDHFDYDGKGFLNILRKDQRFLFEYVENWYSLHHYRLLSDHRNFGFIWQVDNIEYILKEVFNLVVEKESYMGILDHFCNSFFVNLQGEAKERAKSFLINYCRENFNDSEKMNVIVDVTRNSMRDLFEEILLLFLSLTQEKEIFSKIWWRGNGGTYSGDVVVGDLEAADWKNILSIVEKSKLGFKLIPIKKYINVKVEESLKWGDSERQRRFLDRH